jgi:hypothetical protein
MIHTGTRSGSDYSDLSFEMSHGKIDHLGAEILSTTVSTGTSQMHTGDVSLNPDQQFTANVECGIRIRIQVSMTKNVKFYRRRTPKLPEKPSGSQKRISSTSKHEISSLCSIFVVHICPPRSGSASQ